MTVLEALGLKAGEYVHHVNLKNADGTPMRARVTSVKHWKKSGRIEVRVRHGLHDYAAFSERDLNLIELGDGRNV